MRGEGGRRGGGRTFLASLSFSCSPLRSDWDLVYCASRDARRVSEVEVVLWRRESLVEKRRLEGERT